MTRPRSRSLCGIFQNAQRVTEQACLAHLAVSLNINWITNSIIQSLDLTPDTKYI